MKRPSGLQCHPSLNPNSSSYTQSVVPLMTAPSEPSVVRARSSPDSRSTTYRFRSRTKATRLPSGANLANIWKPASRSEERRVGEECRSRRVLQDEIKRDRQHKDK